tara:strand:- start:1971 stop:2285 length:315 start_codon:yes stop_codon:yes gene_type:complete
MTAARCRFNGAVRSTSDETGWLKQQARGICKHTPSETISALLQYGEIRNDVVASLMRLNAHDAARLYTTLEADDLLKLSGAFIAETEVVRCRVNTSSDMVGWTV